jgi:3-dehydroquinate dehydratase-2
MHLLVINGPNLNLLGKREPEIYGHRTWDDLWAMISQDIRATMPEVELSWFQSNHEGQIIDKLHEFGFNDSTGIVLNAGALTHTSIAIGDAVAGINAPVIEVHLTNVFAREPFRHHSYISAYAKAVIAGMGLGGYKAALYHIAWLLSNTK